LIKRGLIQNNVNKYLYLGCKEQIIAKSRFYWDGDFVRVFIPIFNLKWGCIIKNLGVLLKNTSLMPVLLGLVDYLSHFAQTLMILGNTRATEFGTLAGF